MVDYTGERFSNLRLEGGAVSGGVFEDCIFEDCRFQDVALANCRFSGCEFIGCRAQGVRFDNVQALGNGFAGCVLLGVDWASLLDPRKQDLGFLPFDSFQACTLHHCVFFQLDLRKFSFAGCDLSGSYLDGCRLAEADFSGCLLRGTAFSHNDLAKADFRRAREYSFSLLSNQAKGARFTLPEAMGLLYGLEIQIEEG